MRSLSSVISEYNTFLSFKENCETKISFDAGNFRKNFRLGFGAS